MTIFTLYCRDLNLGHCRQITDVSLRHLGEHSRCLQSLNVSGTEVSVF